MAEYHTRKLYNRSDVAAVHGMLQELEHDIKKRDAYVQEKEAEVIALRTVCVRWNLNICAQSDNDPPSMPSFVNYGSATQSLNVPRS